MEYGPSADYGLTAVSSDGLAYEHSVQLPGLAEETVYHLRIRAADDGGLSTVSPDAILVTQAAADSAITAWYGDSQPAGQNGDPQPWVNILGEYSGSGSLSYTLNGGSPVNLTLGSDSRRLWNDGDFNVDLPIDDLQTGNNTVVITDGSENTTVTVNYQPQSSSPPMPSTGARSRPSAKFRQLARSSTAIGCWTAAPCARPSLAMIASSAWAICRGGTMRCWSPLRSIRRSRTTTA